MKKKLMKVIAVAGAIVLLVGCLAGCKKSECYWCNETKRCKMIEFSLIGERNTCKDCEKYLVPISDNLEGFDE